MYGTIAHFRIRPGVERELEEELRRYDELSIPGEVATYVYRSDADPRDYYLSVVFEDRESYMANAESPEQDARYRSLARLFETEPEWHDGEIVHHDGGRQRLAA